VEVEIHFIIAGILSVMKNKVTNGCKARTSSGKKRKTKQQAFKNYILK